MPSCRYHSGYLADDEAGHTTYLARVPPPKKPAFPKTGQASKLGHVPHPPSMFGPSRVSGFPSHRRNLRGPQSFGSFLDFLVEGQVLDSLQRVVEEATECTATMKTETGVPLVEVEDPVEVPRGGRRVRARPRFSTMHHHRVRPSLCTGHPNNYPSCSSSMSDSHNSITAGWPDSHSRDSDVGYHGLGPLPPMRDRLLQEKSLKRLLQLEHKGKSLEKSCSQGYSLLWDSLGSTLGTPEASELIFRKREFNKEIKSLLSQPESFNLPGYSSLCEPHRTLDFLAKNHLFPALQSVVSQAVDKLSGARCHNGCPLFPSEWVPSTEPSLEVTPASKWATPTKGEESYADSVHTTTSSFKVVQRKSSKSRGPGKPKEGRFSMSSAQGATRFRLQMIPTEELKVPTPHPRQEAPDQDLKEQRAPMFSSGPLNSSHRAQPQWNLHLTLPTPQIKVEVPSQTYFTKSPSDKFTKKTVLPSISLKSMPHLSNPWYEELVNYSIEQAVSLLVCKYKFERNLTKQLGFISFPITEVLMDLLLGFKKVKGSHIHLSPEVNWSCLLHKLEDASWAQPEFMQSSQHTSHPTASHRGTIQHSTSQHSWEFYSTLPNPAIVMDQKVAKEPSLHTELPGSQLPTLQKKSTTEDLEPTNPLEPRTYSTRMDSNQSEQAMDMQEIQISEEEEEEEEEEDKNYEYFEVESETQSLPKPQV